MSVVATCDVWRNDETLPELAVAKLCWWLISLADRESSWRIETLCAGQVFWCPKALFANNLLWWLSTVCL